MTFWRVRGTIFMSFVPHAVFIHDNVDGYSVAHSSKYATFVASVSQQHWAVTLGVDWGQNPYVQA